MAASPPGLSQGNPAASEDDILSDTNVANMGIEAMAFEQLQIADSPASNVQVAGGMFGIMRFIVALRNKVNAAFAKQDSNMQVIEGRVGMTESRLEDTKNNLEGKIGEQVAMIESKGTNLQGLIDAKLLGIQTDVASASSAYADLRGKLEEDRQLAQQTKDKYEVLVQQISTSMTQVTGMISKLEAGEQVTRGVLEAEVNKHGTYICLLYTSPSPRD